MANWKHRLQLGDIFHSDEIPFEQKRDEIVKRIKAAKWFDANDFTLEEIVEGIHQSPDTEEFDGWWDEFYDWADRNRVWVDIWTEARD